MAKRSSRSPLKGGGIGLAAAWMVLFLAGCVGSEDTSSPASQITINTPAGIAQASAEDYNDNVNGLITGTTLMHWIDDWETNRPAGIDGRLIILQVNNGPAGTMYITPNPAGGVLTYSMSGSRLTMDRSNGVTTTRSMVPDGAAMDAFLGDYGIDPTRDMLVCAMGSGSAGTAMSMGRCWYMLRYWGVAKEHLAQLNGSASSAEVMDQAYLSDTATCDENTMLADPPAANCLPRTGTVSVRDLPEDNTALQATLGDVIDAVEGRASAFLWDARNEAQYLGTTPPTPGVCNSGSFQNCNSKAGHPRGAVLLEHTSMVDSIGRYKSKAELAAYLNGDIGVDGKQFRGYDAGALVPLGSGNAYQSGPVITYCETTYRAMLTGTVTGVILGLPTRFYDGAMVEWNSMSHIQDKYAQFILPADSPWRTDTAARSVFTYSTGTIDPRIIDDAYYDAPRYRYTNAIIDADRAYKVSGGGASGGGSVLPPNPCGG